MKHPSGGSGKPKSESIPAIQPLRRQTAGRRDNAPHTDRETERRLLSALMDHIPDNIYFKDLHSRFTLINRAMADFFNLEHSSEAIGKTDFDFFTEDHAAKAFEDEQEMIRTGKPVKGKQEKETWPDGHVSWVSSTKMPLYDEQGRIMGTFGISRDISENKRMEAQLRESEARYRALVELAPDIIYRVDRKGMIAFVSHAVEALGYAAEELLGRPFEQLVHPDDVGKLRNSLAEQRIGERVERDIEVRLRSKHDGRRRSGARYVPVSISARGVWDMPEEETGSQKKAFLGIEGIIRDITERKRTEAELRRHRERLTESVAERTAELHSANEQLRGEIAERKRVEEALRQERDRAQMYLDAAGAMIVVLDVKGRLTLINRQGYRTLGYPKREILGRDWFDLVIPPASAKEVRRVFRKLMAGDRRDVTCFENPVTTRSGETRLIAWHNTILTDKKGRIVGTLSSGQDITERKRTEAALLQNERLGAIGAMAGGVALSFNNIISAISGYAASIAARFIPETRTHDEAKRIQEAAKHAVEMTRRLMGLAKASGASAAKEFDAISLAKVVREAIELVEEAFAEKNVRFHVRKADDMPFVKGDAGQLLDALMAVFVNAVEAMPAGGEISIDAGERRIPRPPLRLNPEARGGSFIVLRIRDKGAGIPYAVMQHVFEPFFTTKTSTKSLGLGLPFAQSALRRMGGWIDIHSRESLGTSVRLFLPKAEEARGRLLKKERTGMPERNAVLLVDDHEQVLAEMKAVLKGAGYAVHTAGSVEDGISRYLKHRRKVGLCVVDAMMPGGGSPALLNQIARQQEPARVILTSGFSRDYVRGIVPPGGWGFLQKPFNNRQLLEAARETLRRTPHPEAPAA